MCDYEEGYYSFVILFFLFGLRLRKDRECQKMIFKKEKIANSDRN